MARINWPRLFGSGVLTGAAAFAFGVVILVIRLWLGNLQDSSSIMGRLSSLPSPTTAFAMLGLYIAMGVIAIWLYATMRPMYGAGPETAALAGLVVWFVATLVEVHLSLMQLFPLQTLIAPAGILFVGMIAATELGAWQYKESAMWIQRP